ncbi:MAG: phosphatase domain-containing protein [Pseudobdellovibrio sp.]
MNRLLLFIAMVMLSLSSQAQSYKRILIISDIDDTIKVSHILGPLADKVARAADTTTPFAGMAPLYHVIINSFAPDVTKIVYLSNAPEQIAGIPAMQISHQTFLDSNNFPPGELDLREDIFEENHKIKEIHRLLDTLHPDAAIFLGDNGEQDADIYHQAVLDYQNSGIKIVTFIHQLYSEKTPFGLPDLLFEVGHAIHPEQIGYVTPIEIALKLRSENLLNAVGLDWMIQKIGPYITDEGVLKLDVGQAIVFPFFMNCSDFKWPASNPGVLQQLSMPDKSILTSVMAKTGERCN